MEILVGIFALIIAWAALVRSRQSEDTVAHLRREVSKLTQRQQQIIRELHPEEYQAAPTDPDVEEIEMTAPAGEREQN